MGGAPKFRHRARAGPASRLSKYAMPIGCHGTHGDAVFVGNVLCGEIGGQVLQYFLFAGREWFVFGLHAFSFKIAFWNNGGPGSLSSEYRKAPE